MNKKTFTYLLAGIYSLITMISCTDLDENIYSKQPADEFGKTQKELNGLMGSAYNSLKVFWPDRFLYLSECTGATAISPTRIGGDWYDGGQYRELYAHTWTSETLQIKNSWTEATKAVGTCNVTIDFLEKSEILTEEEKKAYIAEMRGIRAFWQYILVDYWGNIPLVDTYGERVLPYQKSRQTNFEWIISEIEEILPLLPERRNNYGKFTEGAAYTLLAKMYLNAEAWGINVDNAYAKCIEYCNTVMNLGYQLEAVWSDNFKVNNEYSTEAILAACFASHDDDVKNEMMNRTLHYSDNQSIGAGFSSWNGICAQPGFVRLFDEKDPRYNGTFRIGQRYHYETKEMLYTTYNDPLNYTIDIKFAAGQEDKVFGEVVQEAGARCNKWEYSNDLTTAMENDFHIFRLADVYLMKAEALLRAGGSVQEATDLVNTIRRRAYLNAEEEIDPAEYLYQTVDLGKVAMERRFELAWENHSRQDEIRFGTYNIAYWPESGAVRLDEERLKLLPIPLDAWQTNVNLKQNPGYSMFAGQTDNIIED